MANRKRNIKYISKGVGIIKDKADIGYDDDDGKLKTKYWNAITKRAILFVVALVIVQKNILENLKSLFSENIRFTSIHWS